MNKEVKVGENVWVGMNLIILKDSRIGGNLVIGLGSVVCGEIPAYYIATGNPEIQINLSGNSRTVKSESKVNSIFWRGVFISLD
jgi:virginiamycin A acetyltransferase